MDGGLIGKLVPHDFWPSCANCVHYPECREHPKHAAFPHDWHWAMEVAQFKEGMLILKSWVGSSVYGERHTGCRSYKVDESFALKLKPKHERYLAIFAEWEKIDARIRKEEGDLDSLYEREGEILAEMDRLIKEQ